MQSGQMPDRVHPELNHLDPFWDKSDIVGRYKKKKIFLSIIQTSPSKLICAMPFASAARKSRPKFLQTA